MSESDELSQLEEARCAAQVEQPDVLAWFAEARRLCAEAEERFDAGRVLPTLSFLAAVSPLHHMLTGRFSGLFLAAETSEQVGTDESNIGTGLCQ